MFSEKVKVLEESLRKAVDPSKPMLPVDPKDSHSFMVPQLLNQKAYLKHAANRPGVHVAMDVNHLGRLNDTFGYRQGDGAIKAIGNALHAATLGTKGVVGHLGGGRFAAHFEDPEEANTFVRAAENHVNGLLPLVGPHIGDTAAIKKPAIQQHHHSLAVGLGEDYETALHAQELGRAPYAIPGHAPTTVKSLHPAHTQPAVIAKSDPLDTYQKQLWEDELAKSVPMHDSPEPVSVYYLRNAAGPVVANGDIVQGWLEVPEYDRKGQYLALAKATKVWVADEGVAFKIC